MNLQARDRKIRQYKQQGKTYKWISQRPEIGISPERVRQIVSQKISRIELYSKINRAYEDNLINKVNYKWIKHEINRLSKHDRTKESVIQRRLLVRFLVDKLGFSFYQVSILTRRHHTSVTNLYYQK